MIFQICILLNTQEKFQRGLNSSRVAGIKGRMTGICKYLMGIIPKILEIAELVELTLLRA